MGRRPGYAQGNRGRTLIWRRLPRIPGPTPGPTPRWSPPAAARKQKIHPATRVFQALRITVNRELDRLERTLPMAVGCLNRGGRLCVLAFHSLEDRIVKQTFREMARACTCPPRAPVCTCKREAQVTLLTRKVVRPTAEEIAANPMARSTRLRAIEKR